MAHKHKGGWGPLTRDEDRDLWIDLRRTPGLRGMARAKETLALRHAYNAMTQHGASLSTTYGERRSERALALYSRSQT